MNKKEKNGFSLVNVYQYEIYVYVLIKTCDEDMTYANTIQHSAIAESKPTNI